MARKENIISIQDGEQTLTFKVKQMPATQLESWLIRAALLLAGSGTGAEGLEGIRDGREAGAWLTGNLGALLPRLGQINYEKARPLLNELLACCWRKLDKLETQCLPENVDDYIQDVATLFKLRVEALKINLGFLSRGGVNIFASPDTPNTEMP